MGSSGGAFGPRGQQTVVLGPGDSIMANGLGMAGPSALQTTAANSFTSSAGFWTWTQMRLRDRFTVLAAKATGGWGLHDWLTTGSAQVDGMLALKPGRMITLIGTNDLGLQGRTATQLIADFVTLIGRCAAAGTELWILTILPRGGANALSAGAEQYRLQVNSWLQSAPLTYRGVVVVDAATPMTTGASGAPLSSLFLDDLHPNTAGAMVIGRILADALTTASVPAENLSTHNTDPSNVISNGLMAGSSGGMATPGWSVANGSPVPTYTTTKVARTDGPGTWQKVDITVEGALILQHSITAATLVPGERYVAELEFRNASFSSLSAFSVYLLLSGPNYSGQSNLALYPPMTPGEFPASGVLRTTPVYATVASTNVYFWVYLTGLGSVEISRCRVRSIGPE